MNYILKLSFYSLLYIAGRYFVPENLRSEFVGAALIGIISFVILDLFTDLYTNKHRLRLRIHCLWLSMFGVKIRFSMSYQFRIIVDGEYLLVLNGNFGHFQHVGGKYKRLPSSSDLFKKLEIDNDTKLKNAGRMAEDLAVFVPAKNAMKFLDWFKGGTDREVSHWREFYEELIEGKAKLLSPQNFPHINYSYAGTVTTPLRRTPGWNTWEILQYDVYDLIPTDIQMAELSELKGKGNSEYLYWADPELIDNLGHDKRAQKSVVKIGHHAKWVKNLNYTRD